MAYHYFENKYWNDIGDNRTTLNHMFIFSKNSWNFHIFNDSINSPALGLTKQWDFRLSERITVAPVVGVYAINANAWEKTRINPYYLKLSDIGIVPILGVQMDIELFKVKGKEVDFKIKNTHFINAGGFYGFGIFFVWEF